MSTKHTPGPWHVDPLRAMVNDSEALPICLLQWPSDERAEDTTKSNARLIAAAPDLLEALQMLMPQAPNAWAENDLYAVSMWDNAAQSIAKATGKEAP